MKTQTLPKAVNREVAAAIAQRYELSSTGFSPRHAERAKSRDHSTMFVLVIIGIVAGVVFYLNSLGLISNY